MKKQDKATKDVKGCSFPGCGPKTKVSPIWRDVSNETEKVQIGTSGALSSKRSLYYHDIPPELFKRIAKRYTDGHVKYSPDITMNLNWRQGLTDPLYVMDRFNHLFEHLIDFLENGNQKDDNLAAIAWCCGFLMEVERVAPAIINQIIGQARYFGTGDIASSAEGKKKDLERIKDIGHEDN
jgi:hypothetical protein